MRGKGKSIQQFLSIFLSFLLLVSLVFPTSALAVDGNGVSEEALSELELVKKLEAEFAAENDKTPESEESIENPSLLSGVDWNPSLQDGDASKQPDSSLPKVEGTGHPIFEGLPETFVIHSEKSPHATFTNYPGESVATISVDGEEQGTAIGYEFRSAESVHLLLSSFVVTNMIGPEYCWTAEGAQLFL